MLRPGLLFLCLLASAAYAVAQSAFDKRVQFVLRQARPALLTHLADESATGGEQGLLCLAAIHDGVDPDAVPLADALQQLGRRQLEQTYDCSLRLMVSAAFPQHDGCRARAEDDCRRLQRNLVDGWFGYHEDSLAGDLSNTQYAVMGLRAAASLGIDVSSRLWQQVMQAQLANQADDGAFAYQRGHPTTPTMTIAGVTVLAICRQHLDLGRGASRKVEASITRGWDRLDIDEKRSDGFLGSAHAPWSFYFHYGVERAAILCDRREIGGKDWYRVGGEMLCREQMASGGWQTESGKGRGSSPKYGSSVDTAFAILFLRRAFQRIEGPVTQGREVPFTALDSDSPASVVQECARSQARRGKDAMRDALLAMRSEHAPRRLAGWLVVKQVTGQDFGYDPARIPDENGEALRAAELWHLKNR